MQTNQASTILIVDDDEGVAVLERRELVRRGFKVHSASTARDAMAIIENDHVDLLITHLRLPDGATGLDLCAQINAFSRDMPVILVTGFSDESTVMGAMRQGVRDFVPKSTDYLNYLPLAVERVLSAVRTERQLALAEARFQTFMENAPTWAFIKDEAGRLVYANPSLEEVLGRRDWHGRTDYELWPPETAFKLRQRDLEVLSSKQSIRCMQTLRLSAGNVRHVMCSRFAMPNENGKRFIGGMALDLTEHKLTEEALRQKGEQLRQAQKMEAVGQLAGGVAHDFNNLLMVIIGYIDMLLKGSERSNSSDRECLSQIGKAASRAALLTRQLLAFSRKQVLEPRTLDINVVIADIESMLRRLIGEDIIVQTTLAKDLAKAWLDPGQVEQVIVNLAVNARDAMPRGGTLTIKTENVVIAANNLPHSSGLKPGPYVMLSVSDNGCGISKADQAHIFEPFFTTKAPGTGTGLGLATVYGVVKQCEGHISVESELSRGTTFTIYVPARDADESDRCEWSAEERELRGSETVLLVEDEDSVRALARTALQSYGYNVLEAHNPLDAIDISDSHRGAIHVLVTDVVMPHLGGRELGEILRRERPNLKVLYISGYTDDAVVRHGVLNSQANFLQKPFAPASLAAKLRSMLIP